MTDMRLIARMIRRRLEKLPLSADRLDEYKESLRCPKCGAYPDLADRFCMFCGEALSGAATMV